MIYSRSAEQIALAKGWRMRIRGCCCGGQITSIFVRSRPVDGLRHWFTLIFETYTATVKENQIQISNWRG
jgi:hypothetical protein